MRWLCGLVRNRINCKGEARKNNMGEGDIVHNEDFVVIDVFHGARGPQRISQTRIVQRGS